MSGTSYFIIEELHQSTLVNDDACFPRRSCPLADKFFVAGGCPSWRRHSCFLGGQRYTSGQFFSTTALHCSGQYENIKTTLSQIADQLQWSFICPITRFLVSIIVGDWRDGQSRLKYNHESPPTTTFITFIHSLH